MQATVCWLESLTQIDRGASNDDLVNGSSCSGSWGSSSSESDIFVYISGSGRGGGSGSSSGVRKSDATGVPAGLPTSSVPDAHEGSGPGDGGGAVSEVETEIEVGEVVRSLILEAPGLLVRETRCSDWWHVQQL